MKKYVAFQILLFLGYVSWAQNTISVRVDPDNARGGTESEVFDSVRFIPLETTKESLFGAIDQMEVTDSLFIILDISSHSILLFKKDGKFYTKIFTGGGTKYFYYFALDPLAREIIASNNYANGLLVYDFHGKFLRSQPCPENIMDLYLFPGHTVLYAPRREGNVEPTDHILFDLCYSKGYNSVIKSIKPYNAKYEDGEFNSVSRRINPSEQDATCLFSLPFDYSVYQLNDTGIVRKYQFIFPLMYTLPKNFATDLGYAGRRAKMAYLDPGYRSTITSLDRIFLYKDYLFFSPFLLRTKVADDYNFAYNLHTGSLISFSRVSGDSSSCYIPILSSSMEYVSAVHEGSVYSSVASETMLSIKNNLDKKVEYPAVLKAYFARANRLDNAVIVQFNLKSDL